MKNYIAPKTLLQDRVILVTGAGRGVGREAALSYAAHGATVILHGRNVAQLEAVYDEIEAAGYPQAAIIPLDFEKADAQAFEGLAGSIGLQLKRLDGILHNATAALSPFPLELHNFDQWMTLLRVNVAAPAALTKACLPLLKASPNASVIMTGESHGHTPSAFWGAYAVSKAALEPMVQIWAQELENLHPNVRINALIPGPVNSPIRRKTHPGEDQMSIAQPADLMPAYLYLMGDDSAQIKGEVICL
ncbi:YciK family oxidoreductase [Sulfuriferula nivalis]|jgi:NAD(P)-dependent dehydrogenase (short-subunit alcohol dehydrogenase family)|uniref:YciK family oxidoreductase n=1 Tax=Sulfuriferula nivalis TaxID=2675298 RepID=A0A809RJR8_9PROT|nr:YciK family oxidoreductase [Sulfuriferula nivalis]BBP01064.1 YciK family oxidoreductase [Sulfuriferula nivalis]